MTSVDDQQLGRPSAANADDAASAAGDGSVGPPAAPQEARADAEAKPNTVILSQPAPESSSGARGGKRWRLSLSTLRSNVSHLTPARAWDAATILGLALIVLLSFRDTILFGRIAFEADTLRFYYPLEQWFAEELKSGRFPLWNPYIFAGYPIFADGEMGLANPVHLVLLKLLPVELAYAWLRVAPVAIAAIGMFALCRALGVGPLPALIGGTTFSLGSFLATQTHHEDMARSVAWAPMVLACVEWGVRSSGWRRHVWFTGAAASLAMSALGLHPQGLAMTLLVVGSFIPVRVLVLGEGEGEGTGPLSGWGRVGALLGILARRSALTIWTLTYVVGIGLGLAAVQLLPLAEMGTSTFRASQPDYFFATSYALPVPGLVSLLFPYFFRGADSQYWSLWSQWETTVYVGILPLLLGLVGVVVALRTAATYFLLLSVAGLWLAFANYAPVDVYRPLWELPGFSAFRVPGRYSFLFVLGWSVLAAYGAHALGRQVGVSGRRVLLAVGLSGLGLMMAGGLGSAMANLRTAITADPGSAIATIGKSYLALRHHEEGLPALPVYLGLLHSLNLGTPRTVVSLAFLGVAAILLGSALARGSRGRLWQLAAAGVAAVDLLAFSGGLHQRLPIEQLATATPASQFLAARAGDGRVFSPYPIASIQPDRLAPFRIEDLGGYSSLESRHNFSYWAQLTSTQNQLLDLANVRYVVYPARPTPLPSHLGVPFDPERPLLAGGRGSVGGSDGFAFGGPQAHQIRVVAALTHAFEIPQDAVVAEMVVSPRQGPPTTLLLRAGVHLAEWAYDRPDAVGKVQHARPASIAFRRPDVDFLTGKKYSLYLFYSEHELSPEMDVERVEVRFVHPTGSMELYGLGLYNAGSFRTTGAFPQMRQHFRSAYRDAEVEILENTAAFPKAYVAAGALTPPAGRDELGALLYTPFDPATTVLLAGPGAYEWPARPPAEPPDRARRVPSPAVALQEETDVAIYRAEAPQGGFLVRAVSAMPGWRAWVDGEERPVIRANYLFQAVPLSPGTHTVEFRYAPAAVHLGLAFTVWSALLALAVIGGALLALRLRRRS